MTVPTEGNSGRPSVVLRRPVAADEASVAQHTWWDAESEAYQQEHGAFLHGFVWGPEGFNEESAGLLGSLAELRGQDVLEVGCGAGQCGRWLRDRGVAAVGIDISAGMLAGAQDLPVVQADASRLPFATGRFAAAFSSYGALPFVADAGVVLREVARVLQPGGRWIFSVTHPIRWSFSDDPGPDGLVANSSYFDRTPYVEQDQSGRATYVEYHRTLGDWVRLLRESGFQLEDFIEPEWPQRNAGVWGGWSPLRGRVIPGTAIFVCSARSTA